MRRLLTMLIGLGGGFACLTLLLLLVTRGNDEAGTAGREAWEPRPVVADLLRLAREHPLPPGQATMVSELGRTPQVSLHAVQLRSSVALHHHARHDETVCVVAGHAVMVLGEEELQVGPGTVLHIPRGTGHAVTNLDTTQVVVALSCFVPPFDGHDRHLIQMTGVTPEVSPAAVASVVAATTGGCPRAR